MKKTGPTNPLLRKQIGELESSKANIWKLAARELSRPTRRKREVNLSDLQRNTKSGETVLVLGKVLSSGTLKNKLTIAAWNCSAQAYDAVKKAGGIIVPITELMKSNPKGTGVKIIG